MRYFFTKMWPFIRRSLVWVLIGSIGGLLANVLKSAVPVVLGKIIDGVFALEQSPDDPLIRSRLLYGLLLFAGASALYSMFRLAKRLGFRYTENRMKRYLREGALFNAMRWAMTRLSQIRVGDLMSRMVGDMDVMSMAVRRTLTEVFDTVVMMIVAFSVLMHYNLRLTLLVAIPTPLVVILAEAVGRTVQKRSLAARTATGAVVAHLQEAISGMRILRLLGCEEEQTRHLESLTRSEVSRNLSVIRLQAGILPLCSALAHVGTAAVIWVGGGAVVRGDMSIGDLVAYLILFERAIQRTLVMARVLNAVHAGRGALTRTEMLLENGCDAQSEELRKHSKEEEGKKGEHQEISVRNLTFAYPGTSEPVLKDVDLTAHAGQIIAVTGPVGSGKTALARALLGIYPWISGRLDKGDGEKGRWGDTETWGSRPIAASPHLSVSLMGAVAYCPQDAFLFSGTIGENIAFGDAADGGDISALQRAAYIAALDEDLAGFPDGFQTQVGERGVQVSGGQRQRIALARAIYSGKKLLVLDAPFSSVDMATERRIIERMRTHLKDTAILLLSHRLAAFPEADLVMVLDQGRVVEQGTHAQLMRSGSTYPAIYRAQLRIEGGA